MTLKRTSQPQSPRYLRILGMAMLATVSVLTSAPAWGQPAGPSGEAMNPESTFPLADERASYSFVRTLEGSATVAAAGQGVGEAVEIHQPLLTGDLVRVGSRSRLEVTLADRSRLHLDAGTGLVLERIAFSGDQNDRTTVLRLEGGEMLLEVSDDALGDELPRVIAANATIYVQEPGQYRLETGVATNGESWTRLVTRRGSAEIVTDRGSSIVREEEAMTAVGDSLARLELAAADTPDALERWSGALADQAQRTTRSARYVEPQLAYDAAPLDEAGDWVEYESVRYWRPYVSAGWRPYWQGRWSWTPSGYTWISYEPWGWVPYHYGRWCSLPGYGWAWRPGAVYSPAWVYWNWTSDWASWVPIGYYSQFYDPWYGGGFRYGVYGWAGGGWGIYSEWNFAPVHCFRDRNFRGHMRTGRDRQRESRLAEPPRGLLTTDTRDFRPDRIDRTDRTEELLHQIGRRHRTDVNKEMPDVTDFVGRKGKLPTEVARVVLPDAPAGKNGRKDGWDRTVIRDIGTTPKVDKTPAWKLQDGRGSGGAVARTNVKEPPVQGTGPDRKGGAATGKGNVVGSPGVVSGKGTSGERSRVPQATPQTPQSKVYSPGATSSGGSQDRQQWKEKGGENAPVQRVVGSVRRTVPGTESKDPGSGATASGGKSAPASRPPSTSQPKATDRTQPYPPTDRYGKDATGAQGAPGYSSQGNKGATGSQGSASSGRGSTGSQGSSTYGRGTTGSQGSQGSATSGKGGSASSSRGSQGSSSTGRGSAGSQGSSNYGKSSSGSQGSQGSTSSRGSSTSPSSQSRGQGSATSSQGSKSSQSSQGSGRASSGGQSSQRSQRSQPATKSPSASSSSKSGQRSQPPPPPPPEKKDNDGHH